LFDSKRGKFSHYYLKYILYDLYFEFLVIIFILIKPGIKVIENKYNEINDENNKNNDNEKKYNDINNNNYKINN